MKKLILFLLITMMQLTSFAQSKQVTKFLNIPVDGTVAAMKSKLKAKGFQEVGDNTFKGSFDNEDAQLYLAENKGVVYGILVNFMYTNETFVKIHYNSLIQKFYGNKKYFHFGDDMPPTIQNKEILFYELTRGDKDYGKIFYQLSDNDNENEWEKLQNRVVGINLLYANGYYSLAIFYSNEYNKSNNDDL